MHSIMCVGHNSCGTQIMWDTSHMGQSMQGTTSVGHNMRGAKVVQGKHSGKYHDSTWLEIKVL